VLSNGLYFTQNKLDLFRRGDMRQLANSLLALGTGTRKFRHVDQRLMREMSYERAVSRLVRELEKHAGSPNPVQSYVFWNRTRREIAMVPLCIYAEADLEVFTPYLDEELVDFLLALPAEEYGAQGLHDEAIGWEFPEFSDIPYALKSHAQPKRRSTLLSEFAEVAGYLSSASRPTTCRWPVIFLQLMRAMTTGEAEAMDWINQSLIYQVQLFDELTLNTAVINAE